MRDCEVGSPREWLYIWYSPRQKLDLTVRDFAFDHQFKLYREGSFFDLRTDPFEKRPLVVANLNEQQKSAHAKMNAVLKQFEVARPVALDRQFENEMKAQGAKQPNNRQRKGANQ